MSYDGNFIRFSGSRFRGTEEVDRKLAGFIAQSEHSPIIKYRNAPNIISRIKARLSGYDINSWLPILYILIFAGGLIAGGFVGNKLAKYGGIGQALRLAKRKLKA